MEGKLTLKNEGASLNKKKKNKSFECIMWDIYFVLNIHVNNCLKQM